MSLSTGTWAELAASAEGGGRLRLAQCTAAPDGGELKVGARFLLSPHEVLAGVWPEGWELALLVEGAKSLRGELTGQNVVVEGAQGSATFFVEGLSERAHLVVAGRGHVGRALGDFALLLGWRVTWLDERPELRPETPRSNESFHLVEYRQDPFEGLDGLAGAALVIVTHKHRGDQDVLKAAFDRPFRYVGMIGSRRKTRMIRQNLLDEGIPPERLNEIAMPVGVANGGESPEEIALGILDEIVAVRNGVNLDDLRPASVIWRNEEEKSERGAQRG